MAETSKNKPNNQPEFLNAACNVVAAYVGNNNIARDELPSLLQEVYSTVTGLANNSKSKANRKPAVPIDKSVTLDYLICLEDGMKLKMLKRYLRTHYDLSPEEYKRKWGLPADYPMVAPSYAKRRSTLAKQFGLGTNDSNKTRKRRKSRPKNTSAS